MKKLHRLFTAAMLVLALVSAMLLAGCGGSGTSSSGNALLHALVVGQIGRFHAFFRNAFDA